MKRTKLDLNSATWAELNDFVRVADEEACKSLLEVEMSGKRRLQYALRIWSRFNRVRGVREKTELRKSLKKK